MKRCCLLLGLVLSFFNSFSQEKYALLVSRLPVVNGEEKIIARNNFNTIKDALQIQGVPVQNILSDTLEMNRIIFLNQLKLIEENIRAGDFVFVYFDIPIQTQPGNAKRAALIFNSSKPGEFIAFDEYLFLQKKIAKKINDPSVFLTFFDAGAPDMNIPFSDTLYTSYIFAKSGEDVQIRNRIGKNDNQKGFFAKAIAKSFGSVSVYSHTYRTLFSGIQVQFNSYSLYQLPKLWGNNLDMPLFNGRYINMPAHYNIIEKKNDYRIVINAGERINLFPGARVKIYPAFRDTTGKTPLTEGIVESTTSFSSNVKLTSPLTGIIEDTWVYIINNGQDGRDLKIKLNQSFEGDEHSIQLFGEIISALKKSSSNYFDLVSSAGDLKIKRIQRGYGTGMLLTLVNPVSGQVYGDITCKSTSDISGIEIYIKQLARFQYLAKLINIIPELRLDFKLNYFQAGKTSLKENGYDIFFENDEVYMTLHNNNPYKVYFSLIDMQPDKIINLVFPNSDLKSSLDCVIRPYESVHFKNQSLIINPPFGLERFKLFTSLEPIDLSWLNGLQAGNHPYTRNDSSTLLTDQKKQKKVNQTAGLPLLTGVNIQNYDFEIRSRLYESSTLNKPGEKISVSSSGSEVDDLPSYKISNPSNERIYYNVLKKNNSGKYTIIYPEGTDGGASCYVEKEGYAYVVFKNGVEINNLLITIFADRPFNLNDYTSPEKQLSDLLVDIIKTSRISGSSLNKVGLVQDAYGKDDNPATRDGENVFIELLSPKTTVERGGKIQVLSQKFDINGFAYGTGNKPIVSIRINGVPISYKPDFRFFDTSLILSNGMNKVIIEAKDEKGFTATKIFTLELKNNTFQAPCVGKNYFLGIGIDNYKTWQPLNNAKNDIRAFATLIENKFGYDSANITLLLDTAATRKNIINHIRNFLKLACRNDNLIVYLSGHGNEDQLADGGYYFIPQEAEADDVTTAVKSSDIIDNFIKIGAKKCLLIVDACYSGMIANSVQSSPKIITSAENKTSPDEDPFKWIITSGRATKVSDGEIGKNSPFATVLINYLKENNDETKLS